MSQRLDARVPPAGTVIRYHTRTLAGGILYDTQRRSAAAAAGLDIFAYTHGADLPPPAPASLESFLIERHRLYASTGDRLWRSAVAHPPYPLSEAKVPVWNEPLLRLNDLAPTQRPPDHAVISRGVDVSIFSLEPLQVRNHRNPVSLSLEPDDFSV